MGEENIFSYYRNTFKTNRIDWDLAKARQVLHTWQRAYVQVRVCDACSPGGGYMQWATCMELHAVHAGHLCVWAKFVSRHVSYFPGNIIEHSHKVRTYTPCSGQQLKSNLKAMSILKPDRNLHRCVLLQLWQRHV